MKYRIYIVQRKLLSVASWPKGHTTEIQRRGGTLPILLILKGENINQSIPTRVSYVTGARLPFIQ